MTSYECYFISLRRASLFLHEDVRSKEGFETVQKVASKKGIAFKEEKLII